MTAISPNKTAAYIQPITNAVARELDPSEAIVYNALADIRYYIGNFLTDEERGAIARVKRMCGASEDELDARRRLVQAYHSGDEALVDELVAEVLGA